MSQCSRYMDVSAIYRQRFHDQETFRNALWRVLCQQYFQHYIPPDAVVLELAPGYCEFINHIVARKKYGVDINADTRKYAAPDVEIVIGSATNLAAFAADSIDVLFMSNFLEHLSREDIILTLQECLRCLKTTGNLLILQPNIRYLSHDYWMFFDHITPIDDRALCELLSALGFSSVKSQSRFLPYTTKSRLPKSLLLLKIYLKLPVLQKIFGKQSLVIAWK
jgi:SAM-dependent methyltransferase